MRNLIFGLVVFLMSVTATEAAEFTGGQGSAQLPIAVRILDFQTTRTICGSDMPPSWCPAHLLKTPDGNDGEAEALADANDHTQRERLVAKQTGFSAIYE